MSVRTSSTAVGSRSTKTALEECFPAHVTEKKTLNAPNPPLTTVPLGIWPGTWMSGWPTWMQMTAHIKNIAQMSQRMAADVRFQKREPNPKGCEKPTSSVMATTYYTAFRIPRTAAHGVFNNLKWSNLSDKELALPKRSRTKKTILSTTDFQVDAGDPSWVCLRP